MIRSELKTNVDVTNVIKNLVPKVTSRLATISDFNNSVMFRVANIVIGSSISLEMIPISSDADVIVEDNKLKDGYDIVFHDGKLFIEHNGAVV